MRGSTGLGRRAVARRSEKPHRSAVTAPARVGRGAGLLVGFVQTGIGGWVALGRRAGALLAPLWALQRAARYLALGLTAWLRLPQRILTALNPRSAYARFVGGMGNALVVFGMVCLGAGGLIRVSRHVRLVAAAEQSPPPEFEAVIGPVVERPINPFAAPPSIPDRIVIPAIQVDDDVAPVGWTHVFNGEEKANVWETANYAAGFHTTSALPGQLGNAVISGHNNIQGSVFRDLHLLKPGARVYLYSGGDRRAYEVETSFVVAEADAPEEQRLANARWIESTPDERLTLVSCYPPWSNTHRSIVVAKPVAAASSTLDTPSTQTE